MLKRLKKYSGCVLALMLLVTSAVANPQLDTSNPTNFFTYVAMAMFQQMDLHDFKGNLVTVTNIPIYEDPALTGVTNVNYYTPAVHRVLQLAANIFDATTNRFIGGGPTNYPTVFRPIFSSHNGVVYISGYVEVTNAADSFLPFLERTNFVKVEQSDNTNANIYGVPWVIGAKKGFPNFNEFSMDNPVSVSRKLSFTNNTGNPRITPWITNQIYDVSITNSFGFELWNSYTNSYNRPVSVTVSNEMSIQVFDQIGFPFLYVENLPFGAKANYDSWSGWTGVLGSPDASFQLPMGVFTTNFAGAIYQTNMPQFIPLSPAIFNSTFVPHLWMTLKFKVRCVVIDTAANRVIDFVNISSTQPPVDISGILQVGAGDYPSYNRSASQWDTSLVNGVQAGILNQIGVSQGGKTAGGSVWTDQTAQKINFFVHALLNGGTNNFQAPFTPHGTIHQRISWQANDPLVHYMGADLTSTNGIQQEYNTVSEDNQNPELPNLGKVNYAYQPWAGYHGLNDFGSENPSPYDYDVRLKDSLVRQSDEWNFPNEESLSFEWLGRVHRGTPWQTVFLKPSNLSVVDWVRWNNDNVVITNGNVGLIFDAAFSHPTNDWRIASLWARWLNTNDFSTLLSINNTDTNAWAARLDGLTAFTNTASGLDAITITSNSPQAGIIAQAIQTARANTDVASGIVFPGLRFRQVGDVLATRELSVGSPFLNTNSFNSLNAGGLDDEALEKISTQLLPLLRADSFGQIVPADDRVKLYFSGDDDHAYAIQVSSNLTDWVSISTNWPLNGSFGITNSVVSGQEYYRSVLLH